MKANDTQIGGLHYRSAYQHWDFVQDFQLDYFEGCATKYVARRKGNRTEDLKKARHFLAKRMELKTTSDKRSGYENTDKLVQSFCLANKLSVREQLFLLAVVGQHYAQAIEQLDALINETTW